ncbi:MAG: serine/threonine-protein kinase [Candidatus Sulfotelmatobacter sp.]
MFEVYATTRYQQLEQIGDGEGMNSVVFRAFDPYLQREIAVKEIQKANFGNDFDSYCQEARTMFATRHAHIVNVEYVCETPDHVALALPYFPNGSLQKRIENSPLDLRQFLKVAQGILAGVARIHSSHFLHLDIKPSNVFFDAADRPLLGDFGQSRKVAAGTVRFPAVYKWAMPPEVWDSHTATFESDVYQLGVLLYRAVNGDPLYKAQKAAVSTNDELQRLIRKGRFPNPKVFLPHVPKRIRTIIRKAMRVQPSERYRSATDLAVVLGRVSPPLNWVTSTLGGGAHRWQAVRPGHADLEVNLVLDGASGWRTEVWTDNAGERRRKGVPDYWAKHSSHQAACEHLTEVFADLGQ